jgi:hypothetical protein
MQPGYRPGKIVVGLRYFHRLKPGDVVVLNHDGLLKIKRISKINNHQLFVLGDNLNRSHDSRKFGWVSSSLVVAKIVSQLSFQCDESGKLRKTPILPGSSKAPQNL